MTAPRTPSQRGTANRRKGHVAERDVCRWLRTNGFPGAERAVRTGFRASDRASADPGDITGTPGVVWSVKDCAVESVAKWMTELDDMDDRPGNAGGAEPVRILLQKRRGHADPARWWCWVRAYQFVELADDAETAFVFPVRAELAEIVMLLRAAGYGDPLEAAS